MNSKEFVSLMDSDLRMTLRHATALALAGWYLMVPPVTPEGLTDPNATLVNGKAPISQWVIFRAYDSADQCQQERRSGQRALIDAITANPELLTDRAQYGLRAMELLKKGGAQCIDSDDPRLAK
jgi:hypothetical protein